MSKLANTTLIKDIPDQDVTGAFVGTLPRRFAEVAVAALLSGRHAILVGPPGWGKTDVLEALSRQIYGDAFHLLPLDGGTSPDEVSGVPDYDEIMSSGKWAVSTAGTVYDPAVRVGIYDELFRGNKAALSRVLHAADRRKQRNAAIVATTNYVKKDTEYDALRDRFALWYWYRPERFTVAEMVSVQMSADGDPWVAGKLPTAEEIAEVRKAVPGPKALRAVASHLEDLAAEARSQSYPVNPRLVANWTAIAYRVGVWVSGDPDFSALPDEAKAVLRYCYPTTTADEAETWSGIALSITDKLEAAIAKATASVADEARRVAAMEERSLRIKAAGELAALVMSAQEALDGMIRSGGLSDADAELVRSRITDMDAWARMAARGVDPLEEA